MKEILRLNDRDNVVVACKELQAGEVLENGITVLETVPKGHKVAAADIAEGADVVKYGYPIGAASTAIKAGQWVHTHNVKTKLAGETEYVYEKRCFTLPEVAPDTFMGYRREKGVGIRNEIWIIPTVGCVNKIAEAMAAAVKELPENVDGIFAFPHPYGCSQIGDDHENTKKLLAALCNHPNAGGVLLLGLGCENNQLDAMLPLIREDRLSRIRTLICQQVNDEMEEGAKIIAELMELCSKDQREPIPVSELIVGMKCGGSDGFSGITANPLVGAFSDLMAAQGGSTVLTEVPEMFGAENPLLARSRDEEIFRQGVKMIEDFKDYYRKNEQPIYENPSPGNKAGGITTLEEKSLGCIEKAGSSEIQAVLNYTEPCTVKGLQILSAPGNDLVATTTLAASGAHLVLFTTGRGTPFAGPVPTVKISTNTDLYQRKTNWIDFNAGVLLDETDMPTLAKELYDYVLRLASGEEHVKQESRELAIFKTGVTL
ncbi:MAG: altronate dehydratase [Clostridia bacterium]|nr:altronate dehydratase [Clostridia bacterium]